MSSSVRDITESTEAEGRDDTHHPLADFEIHGLNRRFKGFEGPE
jgi:hypothetical protein